MLVSFHKSDILLSIELKSTHISHHRDMFLSPLAASHLAERWNAKNGGLLFCDERLLEMPWSNGGYAANNAGRVSYVAGLDFTAPRRS